MGIKLIRVYCDGIKFAIKFVEADPIIMNINAKVVINRLSIFPIISVGFVKILFKLSGSLFKKASLPETINKAKGESSRFKQMLLAYKEYPKITRTRMYLEVMEEVLEKIDSLVVIDSDLKNVLPVLGMKGNSKWKK